MRISKTIREMEGVNNAVALMATEKAKFALEDARLMTGEIKGTNGSDLVMVVESGSEEVANRALARMEELISSGATQKRESPDILHNEIQAINIGLESFKEALEAQGVKVIHVNWQVPAKGDMKLVNILKKMY